MFSHVAQGTEEIQRIQNVSWQNLGQSITELPYPFRYDHLHYYFLPFILSHRFCFFVFLLRVIQNKDLSGLTVCKVHIKNTYLGAPGGLVG